MRLFVAVDLDDVARSAIAAERLRVAAALRESAGPLATNLTLFDIYRGSQLGEGKKSMAYRITFTAPDRTLTDTELVKVRGKIERVLKQRVAGVLRA